MKAGHDAELKFHRESIDGCRRDYDQVGDRLATLLDLRLDKSITQSEYDNKARQLKERQAEIAVASSSIRRARGTSGQPSKA
jgi:hypothetical protein